MKAENASETSTAGYLSAQRYKTQDYNISLMSMASQVALRVSKEFQNSCFEMTRSLAYLKMKLDQEALEMHFYAAHRIIQGPEKII
jgi:phage tail tube protein FII